MKTRNWAGALALAALLATGCGGAPKPAATPAPAAPTPAANAAKAEVVAHRGGTPENTLSAFKAALATPAVGAIELDVQVTKDGELFIMHDKSVDRTTDGKGNVADLTGAQMRALKTPKGSTEPVPTLDEVLAQVAAAPGKRVFVEIKEPTPADTPAKVLAAVKKAGVADRAIVTSFDRSLVDAVRKLDPQQATGFISKTFDSAELSYPGEYLLITYAQISRDKLEKAHKDGKQVYAWTVDDKVPMETYLRMGCDGVISDEYKLLAEVKQSLAK